MVKLALTHRTANLSIAWRAKSSTKLMRTRLTDNQAHAHFSETPPSWCASRQPRQAQSQWTSGRFDRGGQGPQFFGCSIIRPRKRAQHDISHTRIQITLKLPPDRFR